MCEYLVHILVPGTPMWEHLVHILAPDIPMWEHLANILAPGTPLWEHLVYILVLALDASFLLMQILKDSGYDSVIMFLLLIRES